MPGGSMYTYRNPQTGFTATVSESQMRQMQENARRQGLDVSSYFTPAGVGGGVSRSSQAPAASPVKPVSSSGGGGGSSPSGMIPIRSTIESRYGQGSVKYNPQTRV
jgi:hypothetical protein